MNRLGWGLLFLHAGLFSGLCSTPAAASHLHILALLALCASISRGPCLPALSAPAGVVDLGLQEAVRLVDALVVPLDSARPICFPFRSKGLQFNYRSLFQHRCGTWGRPVALSSHYVHCNGFSTSFVMLS